MRTLTGFLLLVAAGAVQAASPVSEFELDNGLKLIVQEDHRAPVAVVQVWYRVGSSYEHDGITGISHALEHMMFKGTENLEPGEFSTIVAANGGRENAFTSSDYTAYFQEWSADNVGLSFELEAERMRRLVLDEDDFSREINVVLEERRLRTDDNPLALADESARAMAYQTSPYRQPVIGWAADIQNMQVADLRAWYRQWYAPNNATVVVVGDVDPEVVHKLAQKHFGPLEAEQITPPRFRPEVPQSGIKRLTINSDKARVPYLMLAYKAPVLARGDDDTSADWEPYALDVLAETLGGGPSARFERKLVRGDQVAVNIDIGYSSAARLETLFSIDAMPRDGISLDALEDAIVSEIEALKQAPPEPAELERIKTRVVADAVYERDSMFYQGMLIGSLESVGLDWRLKDEYVDRIHAVTPEQVQAVARKYLVPDHLTVAQLLPEAPAAATESES